MPRSRFSEADLRTAARVIRTHAGFLRNKGRLGTVAAGKNHALRAERLDALADRLDGRRDDA
jgi:hypothetical protein